MHIGMVADVVEPAPETAAGFSFNGTTGRGGFNLPEPLNRISTACGPLENDLTRRANHWHNSIIAKPARRNPLRVFLLDS